MVHPLPLQLGTSKDEKNSTPSEEFGIFRMAFDERRMLTEPEYQGGATSFATIAATTPARGFAGK